MSKISYLDLPLVLQYLGYPRPFRVRNIPRYTLNAQGHKVEGNLDIVTFLTICIASLMLLANKFEKIVTIGNAVATLANGELIWKDLM